MSFLRDWVANRIRGTDMRYTHSFHEHGLA